jgi:thiol-disulfide isomerase/thioredoxin
MRAFLAIFLISGISSLPQMVRAEPRQWLTSEDEAIAQARKMDRPILVDLYAEWCGWCKRLEEDVFSTPAFQSFAEDFVLLRVDTEDGGEGSRLQERYDAFSLPTTLVLDYQGVMIAEVKGYAPAAQYVATIQQEIKGFDELIRGYERFGQSDDPRVLGLLADEFHQRNDGSRAAEIYRRIMATGQLAPETAMRIRYQLTDALRLAGHYGEAFEELGKVRREAVHATDGALVQRLDLLAAQISLDGGDCDKARSTLQGFLGDYPTSDLVQVARRTLRTIESEGYQCT